MSRKSVAEKFQNESHDITIIGRNVMVTDAMKQYAIDKLSKIERWNLRIIDVDIVMDIQREDQRVDITMKVDHILIRSSASTDDIYASIDLAARRLEAQLRRYKGRIHNYQTKSPSVTEVNVNVFEGDPDLRDLNDDIEQENSERMEDSFRQNKIVSKETHPLKTLNYSEAIMKMQLSRDSFMVFRAEEDQKLKVIHRREDGNFGIIEPEK